MEGTGSDIGWLPSHCRASSRYALTASPAILGSNKTPIALDQHLASIDQPLDMIINLDVPDQVILERIEGRWIHKPVGINSCYSASQSD